MDKKNFTILLASTILAAFFGAFIAVRFFHPHPIPYSGYMMHPFSRDFDKTFEQPEKMIEHQQDVFDKDIDDVVDNAIEDMDDVVEHPPMPPEFILMGNSGLKTSETKDSYKVSIDLKPFNKDKKNINVKFKGNTLYVSAKYKSKGQHEFHSSQFYQALELPPNANVKAVNSQKEGDFLVITIPKK